MPRLERIADRRFWEIHLDADGKTVHTRAGMLGSDGRASQRKTFPTKKAADEDVKERLQEQLAKGYAQLPSWDEPATKELLEAIANDPSNPGNYLVYADWLQQKRHPRGELIVLQAERAQRPEDKKLLAAETALLDKYPKLAPPRCSEASKKSRKKFPPLGTSELRWEYGFIASARLCRFLPEQRFTIRELLVELLEHPAARFLRRLELGIRTDEDGVVSYAETLAELARLAPRSLRSLSVVEAPRDAAQLAFSELGPIDEVLAAMPNLEALQLAGQKLSFGTRTLAGLKQLTVITTEPAAIASLLSGDFPALETLELDCGEAPIDPAVVKRLLEAERLPLLRHLALVRTAKTDELVEPLADSPLLPRLHSLSLAGGRLRSARTLVERAAAFSALKTLDLSNNELTAIPPGLSSICAQVLVTSQRAKASAEVSASSLAQLSQDSATFAKAKALATADAWSDLGRDGARFWGQCEGSETYDVTFTPSSMDTTCTCPATTYRGRSCKHGVALAMLVSAGHPFPAQAPPSGFGR